MKLPLIPILVLLAITSLWQSPLSSSRALGAPATQRALDIKRWLAELADTDPATRDAARQKLMTLSRGDLPELRRIVADSRPLAPAQGAALHEIVLHVFLASAPYQYHRDGSGFMGVQLMLRDFGTVPIPGAVVQLRFPGLVAFQMLRDGDVIVGAEESSTPITNPDTLKEVIAVFGAGQTVHLKVYRGGRLITVPIKLDFRPANAETFPAQRAEQIDAAEQYWEENLRPLLEPVTS